MKTELLLPVGTMDMCLAAIHHGADAVYMGVPFFNARGRTTDFSIPELKEMIDLCHLYGVKVNLAFNVVLFQNELPKVIELLGEILPLGPDALIVQDLGLASIIRKIAPKQRIHASTQMTVTNADAISFVDDLNIERFVLGRENSLPEIKLIKEKTNKELEVFVHGALCVAYSGQCFTSESLGGRSANRGQCAQSCRLPYELYVDDVKKDLGDKKYLVSPKDLMGISEIKELKESGVHSFKVEGRLKTPEYVAWAAKNYREVIDGGELNLKQRSLELSSTYSRGFYSGWINGVNHQKLVDGTYSSHRGLLIGKIKEIKKKTLLVDSEIEIAPGMGLLFVGETEQGSKVFESQKKGSTYEVELLQKDLKLKVGSDVYLNGNEKLGVELQKGWQSREFQKRIPLKFLVQGLYNEPLLVKVTDPEGREVYAQTISFLAPANARPMTEDFLKEELGSLGNTPYQMDSFECFIQDGLFLNHRELKDVRRELVVKLNEARTSRVTPVSGTYSLSPMKKFNSLPTPGLNIVLRKKAQVEFLRDSIGTLLPFKDFIKSVILDFEFGKDYAPSLEIIKKLGIKAGIATTRILKPGEYHHLNHLMRLMPDFILARNLGAIHYLSLHSKIPLLGDFSLNVTNSVALDYLTNKNLETINVSYDLNQEQLQDLINFSDPSKIEVTIHQYMPEFHMEHCVFAAFLSKGESFRDCGKPCEKHEVKLKDPYGNMHYLKADHECRNTFFKATPQSATMLVLDLIKSGVSSFRVEALDEEGDELLLKVKTYLKLLKGEMGSTAAYEQLRVMESYGLGTGQMMSEDRYRDRKK